MKRKASAYLSFNDLKPKQSRCWMCGRFLPNENPFPHPKYKLAKNLDGARECDKCYKKLLYDVEKTNSKTFDLATLFALIVFATILIFGICYVDDAHGGINSATLTVRAHVVINCFVNGVKQDVHSLAECRQLQQNPSLAKQPTCTSDGTCTLWY